MCKFFFVKYLVSVVFKFFFELIFMIIVADFLFMLFFLKLIILDYFFILCFGNGNLNLDFRFYCFGVSIFKIC